MPAPPNKPDTPLERRSFLRAAGLVGAVTMVSRLLGMVRDVVLIGCLGTGRVADMFWIAFELPNLARRVLGEGSLSAFIVPIYTEARSKEGQERAWRFASNSLTVLGLISLALTALGILLAGPLFTLMSYGYTLRTDQEAIALGIRLTRIMFPFLMLLALSSILMGLCHSHRRFFAPSLGSVMLNLSMIAAGLVFFRAPEGRFAQYLAGAVLAGALLRLAVMLPTLAALGFRYRPRLEPATPYMRRLFGMMLPALFGLAVVQVNITVSRSFATLLGEGLVPTLIVSNRLVQLPLAIVASGLATAILPPLSEHYQAGRPEAFRAQLHFALRLCLVLFLPAAVGLIALAEPIVRTLFEHGRADASTTANTVAALLFYAPALPFWGMLRVLTPVFYARGDVRTPVLTAAAAMLANVALNVLVVAWEPLRQTLGHAGLALASTLAVLVNLGLLGYALERRDQGPWDRSVAVTACRALGAALGMGLAVGLGWKGLEALLPAGVVWQGLALVALIVLGALVYGGLATALRVPDAREALALLLRRGKKLDKARGLADDDGTPAKDARRDDT